MIIDYLLLRIHINCMSNYKFKRFICTLITILVLDERKKELLKTESLSKMEAMQVDLHLFSEKNKTTTEKKKNKE